MSRPSNMIEPPVGSSSLAMQRAIVDLPQPDSPTTPSVSPAFSEKLTPSTALTDPTSFWNTSPRVTGKYFCEPLDAKKLASRAVRGAHAASSLTRAAFFCVQIRARASSSRWQRNR